MKIALILTLLLIQNAFAQKAVFPIDENGKFVPVNGQTTPLEVTPSKLNQKNWNQYRKEVYEKTFVLIQNLNKAMSYDETSETIKIKKETNW